MTAKGKSALEPCEVLAAAEGWLGTPYRHQGSAKGLGCDCLGLLRGMWREIYGAEPEDPGAYAPDWAEAGGEDRLMAAASRLLLASACSGPEPGDVLVFRWRDHSPAKHLGICADRGRFIHAYSGHGVVSSALVPQWKRRIAGIFRFPAREN